jgi:3-dehydrosphinganine reductase
MYTHWQDHCHNRRFQVHFNLNFKFTHNRGIGKALAIQCATENPKRIILIARNLTELENAKQEIANVNASVETHAMSCDVTNKDQVKGLTETFNNLSITSIDFLFIVHGAAYPGYIFEQNVELFEKQMQLNYFGGVYITKEFLPMLIRNRQKNVAKHIVFVTSACAVCTFTGYGSYAPTKYAIRGFAESLHNEMQGHGIDVHISLPSDTDTEGFKNENLTKPQECSEISGKIKVQQPEQPAKAILRGNYNTEDDVLIP